MQILELLKTEIPRDIFPYLVSLGLKFELSIFS